MTNKENQEGVGTTDYDRPKVPSETLGAFEASGFELLERVLVQIRNLAHEIMTTEGANEQFPIRTVAMIEQLADGMHNVPGYLSQACRGGPISHNREMIKLEVERTKEISDIFMKD